MDVAGSSSLIGRMVRAARLDVTLYEEVEADEQATGQAAVVVLLVGLLSGLTGAVARIEQGHGGAALIGGAIGGAIAGLVGWLIWAYLAYWIGTQLFGGTATPGELMRTLGFAQSVGLLNVLAFIPLLGVLVRIVVWFWVLVAAVIAVRQALDFSTEKAVFTVLIGWLVEFAFVFLVVSFITVLIVGAAVAGGAAGR